MTTRARRSRAVGVKPSDAGIVDEGAERYIWVFPEGDLLVLAIPGLRGLKFNIEEARAVAEMLTQAADETAGNHGIPAGGSDNDGSPEECSADS